LWSTADNVAMLHFRSLDVYRSALALVPKTYSIAEHCDRELANHLRRLAVTVVTGLADESIAQARSSALQCAALLDVVRALDVVMVDDADALLSRILAAL
jgi:hypothetical protein